MRNFGVVFKFELAALLKKRSTIIATTVICLLVFGLTFVPRFLASDASPETPNGGETSVAEFDSSYGLVFEDAALAALLEPYVKDASILKSEAELKEAVEEKRIETGVVIQSITSYKEYVRDRSIMSNDSTTQAILKHISFELYLEEHGVSSDVVYEAMAIEIAHVTVQLGKDGTQGVGFVYIYIIVMYMLIILYGASVSNSVAREKDNRTMELLITSTDPKTLIVGKVFSAGLVGVLQFGSIALFTVLGLIINKAYIPAGLMGIIGGNLDAYTLLVFVVFATFGYMLYLFIFAAMGSLVSKMEDVNSAIQPIMMLFILAYFVAMISFTNPDMGIVKVSSYVPFVSLFTMPIRFMLASVSIFDLLISLGIIVLTTIAIAMISIYIYRFGSLNYGNRLKLKDVFKAWKRGE